MLDPASHYDAKYFAWQNSGMHIGAKLNAKKFREFMPSCSTVLDFGCGGGTLLNELSPAKAIGVEINPVAVEHARSLGLDIRGSLAEVETESVDLVISNHALEHVPQPLDVMREIHRVLKSGARAVIVIPCDDVRYPYRDDDKDFHLYSWSPGNLGNLAKAAGFRVESVGEYLYRWPRKDWQKIYNRYGPKIFDIIAKLYARIKRDRTQVRLVAVKA